MLKSQNNIKTYLTNNLNTNVIGKKIYYRASLNSTMKLARSVARKGADEGTIIIAGRQTAGTGRLGRIWLSPVNNIAMSIILRPPLNMLSQIIMISSVAVVRSIRKICNLDSTIKWPNDIIIKGKKVCGILIDNGVKASEIQYTVIGIGMNINLDPLKFPEIAAVATSLSNEIGREVQVNEICCNLLLEMEKLYKNALGGKSAYNEWKSNMEILGREIQIRSGIDIIKGIAEDVTEKGNILLRQKDGTITELYVGDVSII